MLIPHAELLRLDERADQWQEELMLLRQHRLVLLSAGDETALKSRPESYWVDSALSKLYSPFGGGKTCCLAG